MSLLEHMCPVCDYYMPLVQDPQATVKYHGEFYRMCKNCGHTESEKKGLIMETIVQGNSSESYKIFLNEFTKEDPRLPHVKNLQCPNTQCATHSKSVEPDVIYIKYDSANMKYLYICTVCNTQWRSRS